MAERAPQMYHIVDCFALLSFCNFVSVDGKPVVASIIWLVVVFGLR